MVPIENHLPQIIEEQRRAREERSSRHRFCARSGARSKRRFCGSQKKNMTGLTIQSEKFQKKLERLFSSGSMEGGSLGWSLDTVTDSLVNHLSKGGESRKGLPGCTYRRAPGEMWLSRFEMEKNVIVINNGHRDFVYAGKKKSRKLWYISHLLCKGPVLHNFPGLQTGALLKRMIELSMAT